MAKLLVQTLKVITEMKLEPMRRIVVLMIGFFTKLSLEFFKLDLKIKVEDSGNEEVRNSAVNEANHEGPDWVFEIKMKLEPMRRIVVLMIGFFTKLSLEFFKLDLKIKVEDSGNEEVRNSAVNEANHEGPDWVFEIKV
nr:hypothetical protein [Tanacetum cinerariifolium]